MTEGQAPSAGSAPAGPVDAVDLDRFTLRPLRLDQVELDETRYLGAWRRLNRTATLPHCISRLESSGAMDNFRRLVGESSAPHRGMVFQDSDIYKTLEAVAWSLALDDTPSFRAFLDTTTTLLEKVQDTDGYVNSWFQGVRPEERWQDLRLGHEMYCAGHLIQAGIASARGAGDRRLLNVARRFADLLVRRFGAEGVDAICGHPEIETALIELFRLTQERSYLNLARKMLELRGRGVLGDGRFGRQYFQDHLPIREAAEVTGHAVRQLYLLAGAADLYLEDGDASLLAASERLWNSAFGEKTYITGGQGSRHRDEAFGDPYELPADRAHAETCAAVASFMWNWRLLLATGNGRHADEMERVLYNGLAAAVSVDGRKFWYSNPLQLRPGHDGSNEDSPSQRLDWFSCACCPPNLARLIASIHNYVATHDQSGVQLHLFAQGTVSASGRFGDVELDVETDYPWNGRVSVTVARGSGPWTLSLRLPTWCDSARLSVGGTVKAVRPDERGYLRLTESWQVGTRVELTMDMPSKVILAHPRVDAVRGCGALMRGPIVYCIEEGDLGDGMSIDDVLLDPWHPPEATTQEDPLAPVLLAGSVTVDPTPPGEALYRAASAARSHSEIDAKMVAIPYFRWANRGIRAMRVWLPLRTGVARS